MFRNGVDKMNLDSLLCLQHLTHDLTQLIEIAEDLSEMIHIFPKTILCRR